MAANDVPVARVTLEDVLAVDGSVARTTGGGDFGLGEDGFAPKPFARILAEKLALARALLGDDLDLSTGSVVRKLLEVSALEDARTWAALAATYDNQFVASASGQALSRLGEELGVARPFLFASGALTLTYAPQPGRDRLTIPRGARLLTPGGHHVAAASEVMLTKLAPTRTLQVVAFVPGPSHNLDPRITAADGSKPQRIDRWNLDDTKLSWDGNLPGLAQLARDRGVPAESIVAIAHTSPLTGGELPWPDERYRRLLLSAPRSLWSVDAVRLAASLVPGVRRVQVLDALGGLDVNLPVFGQFNFGEALFAAGRDLINPYAFDVLVAPSSAAIWDGPDGLQASVAAAIENLRPVGLGFNVRAVEQVFVGVQATVVAEGLPLPRGAANQLGSSAVNELKQRLLSRVSAYIENLRFGEPVRAAEVSFAMMSEPGVTDIQGLSLLRFPPLNPQAATVRMNALSYQRLEPGVNVAIGATQIATAVNDDTQLSVA